MPQLDIGPLRAVALRLDMRQTYSLLYLIYRPGYRKPSKLQAEGLLHRYVINHN